MKKSFKVLWIVIGSLFAVGIVLTVIGFSLGGTGQAWFDRTGMHFGSRDANTVELADRNSASFENISVALVEADVELVEASSFGYEFVYVGSNEPVISIEGRTLKVIESEDNWSFNILGVWNWREAQTKLTVYVPKGTTLNDVEIITASGDTQFAGNTVDMRSLTCQSASGGINASNLELEELSIDVASGDVTLDSITAEEATINMVSGYLSCTQITFENLVLDLVSGSARVSGLVERNLVIRMISGDADFDLEGSEDDYAFSINRVSGDISINGRDVHDGDWPSTTNYNSSNRGGGRIEIDTTSGSVSLNFR